MIKDIFSEEVANEDIERIRQIKPDDKPLWGKMSADQMLAHCNVSYALTYQPEMLQKPSALKKFFLKTLVKKAVVGEKPYPKNSRTAPEFIKTGQYDFEEEKTKLIDNIQKTQKLGFAHFDGKDYFSFGKMTGNEWNILFYNHLDHHLRQFSV